MSINDEIRKFLSSNLSKEEVMDFGAYLEKVAAKPDLACTAHSRMYNMIRSHGVKMNEDGQEVYLYFEKEIFGIEDATREIMEYFKAAALGSDVSKRFLMLYGPPSSGKSNLVSMLKDDLERWTYTDDGAVYAIQGCPMNENPLNAIPKGLRKSMEDQLGVKIDGELCPVCAHRLRSEFSGDFTKFKANRVYFSQQARQGIGTFVPSDPKSQDIAELIGSVDLSKVGEYGTESDPRAYRFDGELNIANRGLMEFIEILKLDQKFLYVLLTATQERCIKTPRFPFISCDEAIISHTNESEYKEFMGNPKNEALIDRMIVCKVPYNLKVDEEIKIYEKLLQHGNHKDLHVAPHTLRVAAIFAILSRLDEPKDSTLDKIKKMKLYNGEEVEGQSLKDVLRLKRESPTEGMDGISPRYVINRIVTTAIRGTEEGSRRWMTPIDVLRALKDGLVTSSKFKAEERSKYESLLGLAKSEFDQIARNEIQKAFFVSFEDEARALLDNYIDHVEAYLEKRKMEDPISREEMDPDEKLMRSIETKIGIHESAKESFRNEVLRKVGASLRRGEKFSYEKHARLREAIEKQLFEERREVIKMTITSRTNQDPEQLKRINQVVDTLCKNHGYIPESANELLKYVSSIMAREK